jgi:hypothetical protein
VNRIFRCTPHLMMLAMVALALIMVCDAAEQSDASSAHPTNESGFSSIVKASDLVEKIGAGEPVDYDNVTIVGYMDLSGLERVKQPVKITNSQFLGRANFEGVTFEDVLDLRGNVFLEDASFAKARFLSDSRFAGTTFNGGTDFRDSVFGGLTSFMSARFFNDTSFGNARFQGDAVFLQSKFEKDVDFNFAQFVRMTSFWETDFHNVSFLETEFGGHTTFLNSRFLGNATFAATRFNSDVVFRSARFLRGSTFGLSNFAGFADFANVDFQEAAFFAVTKFADNAYFVNASFSKDLILEDARLYSMQLDNVAFGKEAKINLNGTDFVRFVVHWDAIKDRLVYNGAAYLALVKNYKNLEWFDDADAAYYQYRRISQSLEPWGWAKISDIISWLSSGYGVKVSYTVFWCLFTILFFGIVYWAGKGMNKFEIEGMELPGNPTMRPSKRVSLTDAIYFSIAMFTTSQAPVNTYPVGFYRHLAMLEGILGWFFLGLFVVVLSGVLIR